MLNKYVIAALLAILIVGLSYFVHFYWQLHYEVSNDSTQWADLGSYFGGMLSPILSFLAMILLIKSLSLQNEANLSLQKQLENTEITERLKSFEVLFFNMVNSQKDMFDSLEIRFELGEEKIIKVGHEAVLFIEEMVEAFENKKVSEQEIAHFINEIDFRDSIYSLTRVFFILVKMVSEKLNDECGFNKNDRTAHFETLINFTDFSQLRLMLICMRYVKSAPVKYLNEHKEFNDVAQNLKLKI